MDVTRDGSVTAADVVNVINRLVEKQNGTLAPADVSRHDVNADEDVTALDAVVLINYLQGDHPQPAIAEVGDDDDENEVGTIDSGPTLLF